MSMSSVFAVLLVASQIFPTEAGHISNPAFILLEKLQKLVGMTFWCPKSDVDGVQAVKYMTQENGSSFYHNLQCLAVDYIKSVDAFNHQNRLKAKELDKPNLHRLLELYVHTIPLYRHARNIGEMVFENFHQCLKRSLRRNTHHDKHISAVENVILADWLGRMGLCLHSYRDGDRQERESALLSLRRLVMGEDVLRLSPHNTAGITEDFNDRVDSVVCEPLIQELFSSSTLTTEWMGASKIWEPYGTGYAGTYDSITSNGINILKTIQGNMGNIHGDDLKIYRGAKFIHRSGLGIPRRSYPYNNITPGTVVSLLTKSLITDHILFPSTDGHGTLQFCSVAGIIGSRTAGCWLVCVRMYPHGKHFKAKGVSAIVFKLHRAVRRVAQVHICNTSCIVNTANRTVKHSSCAVTGGIFRLFDRRNGFPPHMA